MKLIVAMTVEVHALAYSIQLSTRFPHVKRGDLIFANIPSLATPRQPRLHLVENDPIF
jgi:hypothetical protein